MAVKPTGKTPNIEYCPTMLFRSNAVFLVTILILAANAFRPTLFISTTTARSARLPTSLGTAGKPPPSAEVASDLNMAEIDIPKNLPSAVGKDYVPLATMLATGQLAEADQFTRDALIDLCGGREKGRSFVYWTEVKKIPGEDLATIERLWNRFSGGKFGYSVQREIWNKGGGDWEKVSEKAESTGEKSKLSIRLRRCGC